MFKIGDKVKVMDGGAEGIVVIVKNFISTRKDELLIRFTNGNTYWYYETYLRLINETHFCPVVCKECLRDIKRYMLL